MAKKSNVPEVLGPVAPNIRAQLDAYIEQKMAEIMGGDKTGIFEPFFQRKAIAAEIRKLQTLPQQHKWSNCFKEWGCVDCKKKDGRYQANGMCATCYSKWKARLETILRFTEKERPDTPPFAPDPTDLARAAVDTDGLSWELAPPASCGADESAIFIAAGIPPIEAATRTYVTKAERRAQRRRAQRSERVAARAERKQEASEEILQARALHSEQGLTWKTIAQRLDPEGFANDPAAAAERIRKAARDRTPGAIAAAREKRARRAEILRQAKTLRDLGWRWKAITQRLDPDGFAKDPEAAIVRMQVGVHRYIPLIRDLTEIARSAVRRLSKKNSAS